MSKRVLSVGNCGYDHGRLTRLLGEHFNAVVHGAEHTEAALERLRTEQFDLVVVNRIFDANGQHGLDAIRRIKAEPTLAATPVMLISNYPQYQEEALAAGAEPGFGKDQFESLDSVETLRKFLS